MSRLRGFRWLLAACALTVLAASCTPPSGGGVGGDGPNSVDPHLTDPAIDSDPFRPSFWVRPSATPRDRLVVLFNGTGASPSVLSKLASRLGADGYHVIGLRYDSSVGTLSACNNSQSSSFPDCHRHFRAEVVVGAGVLDPSGHAYDHPSSNVPRADSVMNRLIKMVDYLRDRYPLDGWDRFQQSSDGVCTQTNTTYGGCDLDWSNIVPMGHSQGAGVALYLGKLFAVDRVAMLSGPYDVFAPDPQTLIVAPWIAEGGFQVPPDRIGTLSHLSDPALPLYRAASDALSIPGAEVSVSAVARPYGGSRRLVTSETPGCPFDSAPSHNSTATDLCSVASSHVPAWRYLAKGS